MLSVRNVCVNYGKSRIVTDVSFDVDASEKLVIIGRNGVGKTTLLKSIIGILPLQEGSVSLDEDNLSKLRPNERALKGVAYVPQGREIIAQCTVRENLHLGALSFTKDYEKKIEEILDYFPALIKHMERKGGVLSGGLQQQLAIARALMSTPKALLLDEPTEGIQPNVVEEIAEILVRYHKQYQIPIVVVEQNLRFAKRLADKFVIMQKGSIVANGAIEDLSDDLVNKYLTV